MIPVDGPRFDAAEKPTIKPDKAIIYVYRFGQGGETKGGSVNLSVDSRYLFGVKDTGFTWFYIDPGTRQIRAEWSWHEKPLFEEGNFDPKVLSMPFEAGKTYYINYKIERDVYPTSYNEQFFGLAGKALSKSHIIAVQLISEDEATGLRSLRWCKYQTNEFK